MSKDPENLNSVSSCALDIDWRIGVIIVLALLNFVIENLPVFSVDFTEGGLDVPDKTWSCRVSKSVFFFVSIALSYLRNLVVKYVENMIDEHIQLDPTSATFDSADVNKGADEEDAASDDRVVDTTMLLSIG